jgi:ribosomal small subunit protein bTHX
MGKGDRKTKRGKIAKGSYGVIRAKKRTNKEAPPKKKDSKK